MANRDHLNVLILGGVDGWNRWRRENPKIIPDLSQSELWQLGARVLPGIDLSWCNLTKADLSRVDLRAGNLQGVEAWDANFRGADLQDAVLAQATLIRAWLSGSLQGTIFNNANLSGAVLNNSKLTDADLTATNLTIASLNECDLTDADLTLSHASGATFDNSILSGAKFRKCLLNTASFAHATLSGTDFTEAEMGRTVFADTDLSQAVGLETVRHWGPSTIGIDTLYRSKGDIPTTFLESAGVPETFITYIGDLTRSVLDFYTCFISYSAADDVFAQRLYYNLREAGIRCWEWKENARWGRTLMKSIDDAIAVYDKVIVVCSQHSLRSPAVIREIERALQKEDDLTRRGLDAEVLFPIGLDNYIFKGWNHHRKPDVIAKTVGDFSDWQHDNAYNSALKRLTRDLNRN